MINEDEQIQKQLEDLFLGLVHHPRFKRQEVEASNGKRHEKLWRFILALESAYVHAGGNGAGSSWQGRNDSQGCEWLGLLRRMATRIGRRAVELVGETHKYFDRGMESVVFLDNDGHVLKVRELRVYSVDGVVDQLSTLVYHNYLFPNERYTLIDVVVYSENERDEYALILEQDFVSPKLNADGFILKPSYGQIMLALGRTPEAFSMYDSWSRNCDSSSSEDDENVEAGKSVAYTGNFFVCDFQPGRNTFIDSATGAVRFIDPRIGLNDPGAGFPYSQYGNRTSKGVVPKPLTAEDYDDIYDQYAQEAEMYEEM